MNRIAPTICAGGRGGKPVATMSDVRLRRAESPVRIRGRVLLESRAKGRLARPRWVRRREVDTGAVSANWHGRGVSFGHGAMVGEPCRRRRCRCRGRCAGRRPAPFIPRHKSLGLWLARRILLLRVGVGPRRHHWGRRRGSMDAGRVHRQWPIVGRWLGRKESPAVREACLMSSWRRRRILRHELAHIMWATFAGHRWSLLVRARRRSRAQVLYEADVPSSQRAHHASKLT